MPTPFYENFASSRFYALASRSAQSLKNTFNRSSSAIAQYPAALNADLLWPFLALTLGLWLRGYFLAQPMRGDEAFTFLHYVNHGFRSLFDYSAPNNHVLNTLLIKLSASVWGASPASIRFPAFLAGLAVIGLVFFLARSLEKNRNAGLLATLASAVFPYLILYSTNARGYSLIVALTLLLAWSGYRFSNAPSKPGLLWLALLAALGMLTIPVMILPIAGIFCWIVGLLFVKKNSLKTVLLRFALPFGALSAALTLLFYAPVIVVSHGVASIISNKFVAPQSWAVFLTELLPSLHSSFVELFRDVAPAALLTLIALVALGLVASVKRRNWSVLLLLPCLALGAFFVLLAQHTNPYARTWIYLIPFILLVADAGLVFLLEHLPQRFQAWASALLVLAGLFLALNLMSKNIIGAYPDTSAFPEAPVAVEYLKPIFKPGDTLRISPTADWSVYFYFWYDGIFSVLSEPSPSTGRIFFISKKSRGPLGEAATQRFTLLLDMGNMALYQGKR